MRVLIGAPLRQDPLIFTEHLKAIAELNIPEGVEVSKFYVANGAHDCLPLLGEQEYIVRDDLAPDFYEAGEKDHTWTLYDMLKMCALRSILTDKVLREGYDFLLSVDTDIVMQPETLSALLEAKKPITSEVFWTVSDNGTEWCNAWIADGYAVRESDFEAWKKPGLYQVGMTGALTLIHRSVFEAGVSYRQIPNIHTALLGEDRHFCVRAACAGFEMWLDTRYPATHLYRRSEYERFMEERYGKH